MKRTLRILALLCLSAIFLTVSALADSGPKDLLTVKVENAPEEGCLTPDDAFESYLQPAPDQEGGAPVPALRQSFYADPESCYIFNNI